MVRRALVLAVALAPTTAVADGEPTRWEQLFFPFPIVGAPPQLEQQVQLFGSYFTGDRGRGVVPSAELAYIVSPHLGLVATVPFQIGTGGQTTGLQDIQLAAQYLVAGSLADDAMLSLGVMTTFPTGRRDLSSGDYYVGPFAYAAKRWWQHVIVELDATALVPIVHGESPRQLLGTAMVAVMTVRPVYVQVELDSTAHLGGSATPAATLALAPEIFVGPFASPISEGTRVAAGVAFDLEGDPVHRRTCTLTIAFDIPNKYGY